MMSRSFDVRRLRMAKMPRNPSLLQPEDVLPDSALQLNSVDQLDHSVVADRVAELCLYGSTPLNIALFGPWGSGKSSFYGLLSGSIKRLSSKAKIVRYDAWKYGGESLKRNFITSTAEELKLNNDKKYSGQLYESTRKVKLDPIIFDKRGVRAVVWLFFLIAVSVAGFQVISASMASINSGGGVVPNLAVSGGTLLALCLVSLTILASIVKVGDLSKVTISTAAPSSDEQFNESFKGLLEEANISPDCRLVIFIDELDRCSAEDVVATLTDLRTFLDQANCIFVVAADRDVLELALNKVEQETPVREDRPYYSTAGAFLDKIFQHQVSLPPLRQSTMRHFARSLVAQRGGLWSELRNNEGRDLLDEVIFALIPAHVRSPRRVKVLLNSFATNCRIHQGRNVEWLDRASEIAMLTAIQTEFSEVAADLVLEPRLLSYLRNDDGRNSISDRAKRLVKKYTPDNVSVGQAEDEVVESEASGATQIIEKESSQRDKKAHEEAIKRAKAKLNEQLLQYLRRARAARVDDPRPDLFYLRHAGDLEGLSDSKLGEVIDLAADYAPSDVAKAFSDASDDDKSVAIRLLCGMSMEDFGVARANLVLSACRIAASTSHQLLEIVAPLASPDIWAAYEQQVRFGVHEIYGGMSLAILGGHEQLFEVLLDEFSGLSDEASAEVCQKLVPLFERIPIGGRNRIARRAWGYFDTRPDVVVSMLKQLPEDMALELIKNRDGLLDSALEVQAVEVAQTQTATATAAANPAVAAATAPSDNSGEVAELAKSLLGSVLGRNAPSDAFTSEIIDVVGANAIKSKPVYDVLVADVESALSCFMAPERRNLQILKLVAAFPARLNYWTSLLVPEVGVPDSGIFTVAVEKVISEFASAVDSTARDAITSNIPILLSVGVQLELRKKIVADVLVSASVGDIFEWKNTEESVASHRELIFFIQAFSGSVSSASINRLLVYVLNSGVGVPLPEDMAIWLIDLCKILPVEVISEVQCSLDAVTVEDEDSKSGTAILQVQMAQICAEAGVAYNAISSETFRLISELYAQKFLGPWLSSMPAVDYVTEVLRKDLVASAAQLRKYAGALNQSDRTKLWHCLESVEASMEALRAVGGLGVDLTLLQSKADQVLETANANSRSSLVEKICALDVTAPEARRLVSSLSVSLLDKETQVDAKLACQLVLAAGGPAHGMTAVLRNKFTSAVERNGNVFTKAQKQALVDMNLIEKKKGILERILGQLGS